MYSTFLANVFFLHKWKDNGKRYILAKVLCHMDYNIIFTTRLKICKIHINLTCTCNIKHQMEDLEIRFVSF